MRIDIRTASLDELALAYSTTKMTINGYTDLGLDVPEDQVGALESIQREANERVRTERELKLKRAKLRREGMMTADEKRAKLDAEIKALEEKLA